MCPTISGAGRNRSDGEGTVRENQEQCDATVISKPYRGSGTSEGLDECLGPTLYGVLILAQSSLIFSGFDGYCSASSKPVKPVRSTYMRLLPKAYICSTSAQEKERHDTEQPTDPSDN